MLLAIEMAPFIRISLRGKYHPVPRLQNQFPILSSQY
jgi:hypothetical protein